MPVLDGRRCNDLDVIDNKMVSARTVLCDLDGVVWLGREPIPGSRDAVARLRASGRRVVFVTNNSVDRLEDHIAALRNIGIRADGDIVSSSIAAAHLIVPGERVLVTGGPGVAQAVERNGGLVVVNDGVVDRGPFDAVIVGLHRDFDYARLTAASRALRDGARLIATNSDSTYPTPQGLEPGGGSIVAAVAAAGERLPTFAGKPHQPMAAAIAALIGEDFDAATTVMVGDRPETDGLMAKRLGCAFALVRTGVLQTGQAVDDDIPVAADLADLAAVATMIVG
jgi:4-nitrophenyl phosphatase